MNYINLCCYAAKPKSILYSTLQQAIRSKPCQLLSPQFHHYLTMWISTYKVILLWPTDLILTNFSLKWKAKSPFNHLFNIEF